jgi:outer membrane cobalamin receptor
VLSPTLSLGARLKPSPIDTLYFRSGLTSRLPSLSDRFYSIPGFFEPNPNLRSEKTSSALLGWESALSQNLQQRLESIYQHKRDLQLLVAIDQARYQVQNTQSADLLHLRHQLDLNLGRFTFQNDLLFTRTQVGPLKNPLAYSPLFTHRIGSQALWGALSMGVFFRSQTSSRGPSGRSLGGHSLVDFEGSYLLSARPWTLELSWAVENVLDRAVDLIEDYTADGRRLSLGLVARM